LLADAQSALSETRNAILALDKADKAAALAALERATGKLDLIVARDHTLALAPVSVVTTIRDLYATVDTVKAAVTQAKTELDHNQVQDARDVLEELTSQADNSGDRSAAGNVSRRDQSRRSFDRCWQSGRSQGSSIRGTEYLGGRELHHPPAEDPC
jgi:hypothetical protein